MKDTFDRELAVGDEVAYVIRRGSDVHIERRRVEEVRDDRIATFVGTRVWQDGQWNEARIRTWLKTSHLLVKL